MLHQFAPNSFREFIFGRNEYKIANNQGSASNKYNGIAMCYAVRYFHYKTVVIMYYVASESKYIVGIHFQFTIYVHTHLAGK